MRDVYLFTSKKITAQDCFEALSKEIKHIEMNGKDNIWINAKFRSFLWFYNETLDDFFFESQEAKDEYKKKIPIENPYVTDFETHRSIDLKRVIKEAEEMGFVMNIGPEAEFFLFKKDENGRPTTTTHDVADYYDVGPDDKGEDIRAHIVDTLEQLGFEIEAYDLTVHYICPECKGAQRKR